ncbi:threonine/serine exporter family protein [Salininema proteolyticum]|uniref:Threonine/serine exporter ThrE family protein n=1 Tax=Salininema proteolyticum TaxID=1607685 RepID=A0ABV8U1U5_9ACTN
MSVWQKFGQSFDRARQYLGTGSRSPSADGDEPKGPPPPPRDLIDFLRSVGIMLSISGDSTTKATTQLSQLAHAYGVMNIEVLVLPAGVFVRIELPDGNMSTDFAATPSTTLRLDQIADLYSLIKEAEETKLNPTIGLRRLREIQKKPPRFSPLVMVLGCALLAVGLGLTRNPPIAVVGTYALLGLIVGLTHMISFRFQTLSLALPVVSGTMVTIIAFSLPDAMTGGDPIKLLIPPLIIYLPGAALTIGTMELATGSIMAGSARMMYAFNVLFLLAFGIFIGYELMSPEYSPIQEQPIGQWVAWLGVAVTGMGYYFFLSAPKHSIIWVLISLYAVWLAMYTGQIFGSTLLGAFLAGLILPLVTYSIEQQKSGPPAQVTFFPAFWLVVPGALGLAGVSEFVTKVGIDAGIYDVITALVTVMSIALGVLVGSSLTQTRLGIVLSFDRALPTFKRITDKFLPVPADGPEGFAGSSAGELPGGAHAGSTAEEELFGREEGGHGGVGKEPKGYWLRGGRRRRRGDD